MSSVQLRRATLAANVFGALGLLAVAACSRPPTTTRPAVASPARRLVLEELLSRPADATLTLHPRAIARDRVYGPLLRRASALAAAYAGPRSLGTTALVALERTEEVDAATGDSGEAVVLLQGVPADLDVTQVVDEAGHPVWKPAVGDVRQSFVEYESASGSDASLFVLPERTWIAAAGSSRGRTREALIETTTVAFAPTFALLAELSIRGGVLVRRDERLRTGPLAPVGQSLVRASFALTPGAEGVIVARLSYSDGGAAEGAERTAREVVSAFRRRLEQIEKKGEQAPSPGGKAPPLAWLAAAGIERTSTTVNVRAPIPREWLDAIAAADVSAGQPAESDVPWALWRRTALAPALSLPLELPSPPVSLPLPRSQEPSQGGGSL